MHFFISNFNCSMLVYKKANDFCISILYLALFLIIEEKHLDSHHWVWCQVQVSSRCSSSSWSCSFSLMSFIINGCWILSNVISICIGIIIWLFFISLLVTDCNNYFLNAEPVLYTWNKSHLVVVSTFYILLGLICWYFWGVLHLS